MTYETEGYVKSLKIGAGSSGVAAMGFMPTGGYLIVENDQSYCLFKAGSSGEEKAKTIDAELIPLGETKMVNMQVGNKCLCLLTHALIIAKANHSKIRVTTQDVHTLTLSEIEFV